VNSVYSTKLSDVVKDLLALFGVFRELLVEVGTDVTPCFGTQAHVCRQLELLEALDEPELSRQETI